MKIAKMMCHRGVDRLLKAALGDSLQLFRIPKDPASYLDKGLTVRETEDDNVYDIFIQDDISTWENAKVLNIKYKKLVWYVHGTYTYWKGFQGFANANFAGATLLFTDLDRKKAIEAWYEHPFDHFVQPLHLTDDYYVEPSKDKNGRACIIGTELLAKMEIYKGYKKQAFVFDKLRDLSDVYGYNSKESDRIRKWVTLDESQIKGSARIRDLSHYSASLHPSTVPTCGFVQLEAMAAGLATVTTPKVDFPIDCQAPFIARSADSMVSKARELIRDKAYSYEMGLRCQKFLRDNFPFSAYRENMTKFLFSLC